MATWINDIWDSRFLCERRRSTFRTCNLANTNSCYCFPISQKRGLVHSFFSMILNNMLLLPDLGLLEYFWQKMSWNLLQWHLYCRQIDSQWGPLLSMLFTTLPPAWLCFIIKGLLLTTVPHISAGPFNGIKLTASSKEDILDSASSAMGMCIILFFASSPAENQEQKSCYASFSIKHLWLIAVIILIAHPPSGRLQEAVLK